MPEERHTKKPWKETPWKDRARSNDAPPHDRGKPKAAWSKAGDSKSDGVKPAWSKSGADKSGADKASGSTGKKDWADKKDWANKKEWPAKTDSTGKKDWGAKKEWTPKKEWAAKTGDATKKDWAAKTDGAGSKDSAGKKEWTAKKDWGPKKDWAAKKDGPANSDTPARNDAPVIDPAAAEARKFDPNQRGVGKRTAPHGGKPGGHSRARSAVPRHGSGGDRKHGASKPTRRAALAGDARTPSKYAHKKKSRPAPSAKGDPWLQVLARGHVHADSSRIVILERSSNARPFGEPAQGGRRRRSKSPSAIKASREP